jgi:hypothetical protein
MMVSEWLAKQRWECFNQVIETGVLHEVGLRNTLEPDPDNAGVGSFPIQMALFLDLQREFSCFMNFKNKGSSCSVFLPQARPASHLTPSRSKSQDLFSARRLIGAQTSRVVWPGPWDCCFAAWLHP